MHVAEGWRDLSTAPIELIRLSFCSGCGGPFVESQWFTVADSENKGVARNGLLF
jgi:hypothetical protein